MKYRKKPVVIEAMQWSGTLSDMRRIQQHMNMPASTAEAFNSLDNTVHVWRIPTLEGSHIVSPGDYIIRGVAGEFYPCKPDIFVLTYEALVAESAQEESK